MAAHKIPPNGTLVSLDTEPNRQAHSGENAFSGIQVNGEVRIDKAEQCLTTFRNPGSFSEYRPRKTDGKSVLCEGFSIREYVAKVRSVDIRKCWPLSESLLEESFREGRNPTLPPLVRPNHRWWSCFDMCGEHKHFGASFDRRDTENYSQNVTHIEEQHLMVSLETDPDVGPWISQDEQLRKLRTVQISTQEDLLHIPRSEYAIKNIENKNEMVGNCLAEEHDLNFIAASSIKDGQSKIEAPKRTSMSDVNADQLERIHKRVKADLSDGNHAQEKPSVIKDFHKHTEVKSSTVHLMEKEGDLQNDIGNCKKKAKVMRGPDEPVDQALDQSVTLCERNKIDERNSDTAKIESHRQHNLEIGITEGSGVKICPVCRTFTSATITAVNAHMDNCLAQVSKTEKGTTQKQKSRARKKRSIVDICAAAPPVKASMEYLDNYQMDGQTIESDCSDGIEVSSDQVTDNGTLNEVMTSIQTVSETATTEKSITFKCKRKQPVGAHYLIGTGKPTTGDGQGESLEMKRRRQRLGIITCGSGSKDLKESWKTVEMPSSTQATEAHKGVEHHLMHHAEDSGKQGKLRQDSNGEQLSNMQLNSVQNFDVAGDVVVLNGKSQQQWSGTLMDNATPHPTTDHSATMLPEELKALKYSTIDIPRGENGQLRSKESTGNPSPVPTISNGTGNVSHISGVFDTVPSGNEPTHVHTEKAEVLGDSECTHQNGGNCKLQVEEGSSKQGYLNLLNKMHFKDSNSYMGASTINPGKMVGSKELNGEGGISTCSKPSVICSTEDPLIRANVSSHCVTGNYRINFAHPTEEESGQHVYANYNLGDASNSVCLQSVDRTRTNSMALHSFQKETIASESRKVTEGPTKNTGLNLNQKICVLPRDSKGRFISSARMNGGNEGEILYSRWKPANRHKPIKRSTNSAKTSAVHNETNFVMNTALSNARFGKSTSIQTLFPVHRDYHGGKRCLSRDKCIPELNGAVAGQAAFSSGDIELGSVGMQIPFANTKSNHVAAPLPEKARDLPNFFIQRRCSDYGYIGWPLDSQGELIKYIPNTSDGVNELYRIQNCTTGKELLVAECSQRLPDFNFVESMHVSNNISADGRILKICSDSALCNLNDPSQQNSSSLCKQTDCCHQHLASRNNQLKRDKVGLAQSSALRQIQSEYVGNSQIRTTGSSVSKTDTSSTLTACMHSNIESGYNGEQKKKSPVLERTCPEVQSSRKEQLTTQPVMRLMGHNFIIVGENEAGNTVKEYQQGSDKKIPSTSEVTWDVSSSNKSNKMYRGYSTACKEGELSFPYPGINALCQHSMRNENLSECPQKNCKPMESLEATSFARNEDLKRLNSSVPKLVEKRFPTSCVRCEQSLRGQFSSEPGWTSTSPFCAIGSTVNSPFSHLSNNVVNQGDKVASKYSSNYTASEFGQTEKSRSDSNLHGSYFQNAPKHIRDPARLHQNQVYSQNQSPSLEVHAFPKPVSSGCIHTSRIGEAAINPGSLIIQSDALQILENQSKCKSSLPQWLLNAQKQNEAKEGTSYNKKQHNPPILSSRKMEFVTQKLPCVSSSSVSFSDPLHDCTSAPAHPPFQTTFPSDCETLTPTDSATLKMNWRYKYDSINLLERETIKLTKNMSRNICVISHNKGTVPHTVNLVSPESKCRSDRRTGPRKASDLETKELQGKCVPQRHEGYAQSPSQRCDLILTGQMSNKRKREICHEINSSTYGKKKEISENDFVDCRAAEICIANGNSVDIAMGDKNTVNDTFSNPSLISGVRRKCQENEETFRKPKSNLRESQNGTSRIGLHSSSIEYSLKLAEPMKLSGGAKHILKPPPPNGNVKQSVPIHYTLPFVETAAEERERNLHGTDRYSGEQQRSPPGSKLLRWASSNNNLSQIPSNGEGRLSH